ncbi:MAG: hypothetical protein H8E44_13655 [Planctomycetes bacterium]|nr:hypothetical protein [Planctomycetota bacterium]
MRLREFNDAGIDRFREFLVHARHHPDAEPPWHILRDEHLTKEMLPAVELDRPGFSTKRDAAEYLHDTLAPLPERGLMQNVGLWSWLSLYYFDDLCPKRSGKRRILTPHYYVTFSEDERYHARHLLASSYLIRKVSPQHNRVFLESPITTLGKVIERTLNRLFVLRVPAVFEVIDRLYFDQSRGRVKKGIAMPTPRAGDLANRLPARIRQLERTYDLHSLPADQLIELMGDEFSSWLLDSGEGASHFPGGNRGQ